MDHDHMEGMTPPTMATNGSETHQMSMTTHMTFYWGKNGDFLFSGWPGTSTGMYVLALFVIFIGAVIVEWLSQCQLNIKSNSNQAGLARTMLHGIRIALAYLVMLALMSFNVGVLLVAVAGHMIGFLIFRSKVCMKSGNGEDLPK